MPTYDYQCEKCGDTFEVFQSMNDKKLTRCPEKKCKGKVQRLLGTGAGIIFKGSGFYETDYRSESYKAGEKAANSDSSSSDGGEKGSGNDSKKTKDKPAKKKGAGKPKTKKAGD